MSKAKGRSPGPDGNRRDGHRHFLPRRVVAAQGSPHDGDVDRARRHGVHDRAGRILCRVERAETHHVVHDVALAQLVHRRRVAVVVAQQVHADFQRLQDRVVERRDGLAGLLMDEDVAGSVVRLRGAHQVVVGRHADHDVAAAFFQRGVHRVADETAALTPPDVEGRGAEVLRQERRDLVFESVEPLVGQRHVLGIGADAESAFVRLRRRHAAPTVARLP